MTLDGKNAVITGSTRGIGKAIALRFARMGAKVAVNGVSGQQAAEAVAGTIRDAGGEAIAVRADVARRDEAERLVREAIAAFGHVDIMVSNAGIIIDKAFVDSAENDFQRAVDVNLRGFFNVAQAVLPHMIQRGYGRLLATGSCIADVADFGGNKYSVCAASKGGIVAMMRPIAAETARHGVTVNAVSPGYIATEMFGTLDPAGLEAALGIVPMRRYGKPEEVAAAMAFLASDDAAYITGQVLRVNGGMAMA